MTDASWARTYTLTVPTEKAARAVADRLAERGHLLTAVRIVDHFSFEPGNFWYGKPSMRPEFSGWWDVFSVVLDDQVMDDAEKAAVADLARESGGISGGAGSGHRDTVLQIFNRTGLVHELTPSQAARRRPAPMPVAAAGELPPGPPLESRPAPDLRGELIAVTECCAGDGGDGAGTGDLLGDLFNAAMHQGTCYPHTAGMVPVFVELAADDRLGDRYRGWVLMDLFLIASVGRRDLASMADTLRALGKPAVEAPEAVAAREAVTAAVPGLLDRWEEASEHERFLLAALAAACSMPAPDLGTIRDNAVGTTREATIRLIDELAEGTLRADAEQRALGVLMKDLGSELG
ncbi:hypothetical protein [Winogradskya consettensis]|uniref:hypothetical protein n=1 Tax=Winogradskya consettensis TaxID=113560 RepID=UPI001BB36731|nr:hypothetical protein [Actinoplanes consettensis]